MCDIGMRDSLVPEWNEESTLSRNEKITIFFNEPGLYSLVFKSKRTEAEHVQ